MQRRQIHARVRGSAVPNAELVWFSEVGAGDHMHAAVAESAQVFLSRAWQGQLESFQDYVALRQQRPGGKAK